MSDPHPWIKEYEFCPITRFSRRRLWRDAPVGWQRATPASRSVHALLGEAKRTHEDGTGVSQVGRGQT